MILDVPRPQEPLLQEPDAATKVWAQKENQTHRHRDEFGAFALNVCQSWIGLLFVIIIAQFVLSPMGYGLKSAEFIAVVSSTTVAVLGFGFIWGRGLYDLHQPKDNS